MTRITRPFFVAAALLLATSPALAQKVANKRAVDRAIDIYDPTLRGSQQTRDRNAGANDRDDDDDDRFDRDDDDDRYEHDRYEHDRYEHDRYEHDRDYNGDGPGKRGRGHAYGHEKQKGRKGVKCYDRNYDSICDDAQTTSRGRTDCAYDARTGRCTYGDVYSRNSYPASLPDMVGAVIAARGQRSAQAAQWLGTRQVSVRTERARRGGITRASWFDTSGQLVQAWIDRDLDGRADAVQLFRNGQLLRTLTR